MKEDEKERAYIGYRFLKTEEAMKEANPLEKWRSDCLLLSETIKRAEKQILDTRANRVNNICFAMLILLYAIGVGIALKYLV